MSSNDPDEIREQIERTRADLSQNVNSLADTVNPAHAAKRQADRVRGALTGAKDKVMGGASTTGDNLSSARSSATDAVAGSPDRVKARTSNNPLALGLIAFGAGWLAGSLVPASSAEQQAAVRVKEAATPYVSGAAHDVADNLKQPAQHAASTIKDAASDAADTVKSEGSSAAQDVKDEAQHAKDAVQTQAS